MTWWNFWISRSASYAMIWSKTQFASYCDFHCDFHVTSCMMCELIISCFSSINSWKPMLRSTLKPLKKIVIRQEDFYHALKYDIKPVRYHRHFKETNNNNDIWRQVLSKWVETVGKVRKVKKFEQGDVNTLITYVNFMNLKSVTLEVWSLQHVITRGQEYWSFKLFD